MELSLLKFRQFGPQLTTVAVLTMMVKMTEAMIKSLVIMLFTGIGETGDDGAAALKAAAE